MVLPEHLHRARERVDLVPQPVALKTGDQVFRAVLGRQTAYATTAVVL